MRFGGFDKRAVDACRSNRRDPHRRADSAAAAAHATPGVELRGRGGNRGAAGRSRGSEGQAFDVCAGPGLRARLSFYDLRVIVDKLINFYQLSTNFL